MPSIARFMERRKLEEGISFEIARRGRAPIYRFPNPIVETAEAAECLAKIDVDVLPFAGSISPDRRCREGISPTRRSSNVRAGTTVKLSASKVCAVSATSAVEFTLSSFPLLFFEDCSALESGVDARLSFGRLMAATAAAPPKITLRRDKRLDPSSESGEIPNSASVVCAGDA